MTHSIVLSLAILAASIFSCNIAASAAELATVRLADGRVFTATIDPQTDQRQLVLRFEGVATTLWRPVAWAQIESATVGDEMFSAPQLRERWPEFVAALPADGDTPEDLPRPETADAVAADVTQAELVHAALEGGPLVRSVAIEAYAANWDGDVELDGLVLEVTPLDEFGRVVAVEGALSAELFGLRPEALGGKFVRSRGTPFPQLATWIRRLEAFQLARGPARFKLPFQAIHPEFRHDLAAIGLVHVRLSVPGHGVFEASQSLVRLRPFSPTRDHLQQFERRRFFPNERTGRTQ